LDVWSREASGERERLRPGDRLRSRERRAGERSLARSLSLSLSRRGGERSLSRESARLDTHTPHIMVLLFDLLIWKRRRRRRRCTSRRHCCRCRRSPPKEGKGEEIGKMTMRSFIYSLCTSTQIKRWWCVCWQVVPSGLVLLLLLRTTLDSFGGEVGRMGGSPSLSFLLPPF